MMEAGPRRELDLLPGMVLNFIGSFRAGAREGKEA